MTHGLSIYLVSHSLYLTSTHYVDLSCWVIWFSGINIQ